MENNAQDPHVALEEVPLHSTNLLTVLDPAGTILYESPAIERLFGFEPATLVGESVVEYFHPDDRPTVHAQFEAAVDRDDYTVESVEYRHRCADGSYQWVESVTSSRPTANGNYVVNTRDIEDRRAREQQLQRTNDRLDKFASVVSHDLRNPLTVAQNHLEMARETTEDEHLDAVESAHDRMEALIETLLSLARSGADAIEPEAVDLASVSQRAWASVDTGEATLEVETDRTIVADPPALQQLIENLLRNAVTHGEDLSTVTVGTAESGFFVADDGTGIPPAEREQVFEAGHTSAADGTGLGMSIVQEIADAHGWTVSIESADDGGACIDIDGVELR